MNISEAKSFAAEILNNAGVAHPHREAASLLGFAIQREAAFLIAHPEYQLTQNEAAKFRNVVDRRSNREPFQYITGRQEFFGLEFNVSSHVLIPRPETEILVEEAIKILSNIKNPVFFEIGIGSGCISVSILCYAAAAMGTASDISATR